MADPTLMGERPAVEMSIFSNNDLINSGRVVIGTKIRLEVATEEIYRGRYDLNIRECTASTIMILNNSCPVDIEIFPGFSRFSGGVYETKPFPVFRPNQGLRSEASIVFSCRVSICRKECEHGSCFERTPGYGRRKRSKTESQHGTVGDVTVHAHLNVARHKRKKEEPFSTTEDAPKTQICMDVAVFVCGVVLVTAALASLAVSTCCHRMKTFRLRAEARRHTNTETSDD